MRAFLILCSAISTVFCGPLGVGVKAGVPATDLVMSSYWAGSSGSRLVIGPSVELRLPFGLGIEVDALHRHVNNPSGSAWEFPILARYRLPVREVARPYLVGGGSFQRNDLLQAFQVGPTQTTPGFVLGGGLEAKLGPLRLGPEIRYTRWTGDFGFVESKYLANSAIGNLVHRNQVEVLVGLTF